MLCLPASYALTTTHRDKGWRVNITEYGANNEHSDASDGGRVEDGQDNLLTGPRTHHQYHFQPHLARHHRPRGPPDQEQQERQWQHRTEDIPDLRWLHSRFPLLTSQSILKPLSVWEWDLTDVMLRCLKFKVRWDWEAAPKHPWQGESHQRARHCDTRRPRQRYRRHPPQHHLLGWSTPGDRRLQSAPGQLCPPGRGFTEGQEMCSERSADKNILFLYFLGQYWRLQKISQFRRDVCISGMNVGIEKFNK